MKWYRMHDDSQRQVVYIFGMSDDAAFEKFMRHMESGTRKAPSSFRVLDARESGRLEIYFKGKELDVKYIKEHGIEFAEESAPV